MVVLYDFTFLPDCSAGINLGDLGITCNAAFCRIGGPLIACFETPNLETIVGYANLRQEYSAFDVVAFIARRRVRDAA